MSGIAGIYCLDGRPVDPAICTRMVEALAYRGPDAQQCWIHGPLGLGHRMLWTTPESVQERQPLQNEDASVCLTADARVDNREALHAELAAHGMRCRTNTDAELILRAYEVWGEACPGKILGDFAFVIWDGRRQRLFCARDPIGIKPFYYSCDGKTFRWASDPRALFDDGILHRELNVRLLCLYLLHRFDEREETLYRGIYRLPPAHCMVLAGGHLRKTQYWNIDPGYTVRYRTDAEYAAHFLDLFHEAVRTRLRSHGPVGALLSGGLDSSSVVCTAQNLYRQGGVANHGFETFSMVFDGLPCDERPYIDAVVRQWDLQANYFSYEKYLSSVDFEQVQLYPDVFYGQTLFMLASPLMDARQKGIRVVLDGLGGDDLLQVGLGHLIDLLQQGRFRKLMMQLRQDAQLGSVSPVWLFLHYCLRPLIAGPIKTTLRPLLKRLHGDGIPSWMNRACLRETGVEARLSSRVHGTRFPTRAQQQIYDTLVYGWNTNIALGMVEKFATHFGIESRHPFFDRRLVEFLLAVPEEQRWNVTWPKAVLRCAMQGILPERVRTRQGKAEFSCVVHTELKTRQSYKVEQLLQKSNLAALGLIHVDQLQRLFERYRSGADPHGASGTLEYIVMLELWYGSAVDTHRGEQR